MLISFPPTIAPGARKTMKPPKMSSRKTAISASVNRPSCPSSRPGGRCRSSSTSFDRARLTAHLFLVVNGVRVERFFGDDLPVIGPRLILAEEATAIALVAGGHDLLALEEHYVAI